MDKTELINHTLNWTRGACADWNDWAKQFDQNTPAFLGFVHRTHHVVWRYINGQQQLDGSCSDLECDLAMKARALFQPHITS